ncbi:hypothetical protein FGO68_gene16957 [Halteria grandinella]|uniref:Peptidoglycan binding-like domain-containing protein n=1 Tax=Halteria grandinella TaxID=5974 RepID=A0A8J8T1C9_HALGN|nr:hypothetical protein FGO68_gene16957 [Halteria grandinella]
MDRSPNWLQAFPFQDQNSFGIGGDIWGLSQKKEDIFAPQMQGLMDAFPQLQQNPSSNLVLKKGSSGESVRELQEKLVQNGAKIQIDGKYGPATERAVRDYQATYGLQCDGIAGRNTFASMNQSSYRPTQTYTNIGGLQSYGFSGSQSLSALYTPQTSTQFLASLHRPQSTLVTPPTASQFLANLHAQSSFGAPQTHRIQPSHIQTSLINSTPIAPRIQAKPIQTTQQIGSSWTASDRLVEFVKKQEGKFAATPKPVIEKVKDGNTHYVGYSHNINPKSQYFGKQITETQATALLKSDLSQKAKDAKKIFEDKEGKGKFDQLTQGQKELLVDFQYNGCLQQFPKMMKAVANGDKASAKLESERFYRTKNNQKAPLKERNKGTKSFIDGSEAWKNVKK